MGAKAPDKAWVGGTLEPFAPLAVLRNCTTAAKLTVGEKLSAVCRVSRARMNRPGNYAAARFRAARRRPLRAVTGLFKTEGFGNKVN
jgi:hypothetical protein